MRCRSAIIIVMLLLCEESFAQVFKCKDPVTGQTTFTDKSCGTSGQREHVPLNQTNGMTSPDPSQFQSRDSDPNIVRIGSDPSADNYQRMRRHSQMEAENARSIDKQIPAQRSPPIIVNTDPAGAWDTDSNRYTKGAGNTYFRSDGKTCQLLNTGMQCN